MYLYILFIIQGVDAALIETDGESYFKQVLTYHLPYSVEFQKKLRTLLDDWSEWLVLERELTIYHVECVKKLIKETSKEHKKISIIGFHGQTIYHNAEKHLTWQFGNPHLLAQLTGKGLFFIKSNRNFWAKLIFIRN
jgi:anhydro-N-acetylmuramic acid kinase